jgi:hypothetical protein
MNKSKIIIISIAVLLFLGAAFASSYYLFGGNKVKEKFVNTQQNSTTIEKVNDWTFKIKGKIVEPLKYNSDGMIETRFVLNADPNRTPVRLIFFPNKDDGTHLIRKNGEDSSLTSEKLVEAVKQDSNAIIATRVVGEALTKGDQEMLGYLNLIFSGNLSPISNRKFFLYANETEIE